MGEAASRDEAASQNAVADQIASRFRSWIKTKRGLSTSTASAYTSRLKRLIKTIGPDDLYNEARVAFVFETELAENAGAANLKTTWNAFAEFLQDHGLRPVPMTKAHSAYKATKVKREVGPHVVEVIKALRESKVALKVLPSLRWKHVEIEAFGAGRAIIYDPERPYEGCIVPLEPVRALAKEAMKKNCIDSLQDLLKSDIPVFADPEDSSAPLSYKQVKALIEG